MLRKVANEAVAAALRPFGLQLVRTRGGLPPQQAQLAPSLPPLSVVHTEACRVLPDRDALLKALPTGGVAAEAGVADGDFSAAILSLVRPSRLYLIDSWASERYRRGLDRVQQRFADEITSGVVVIHQDVSTAALGAFADSSLDWVYIDTDHTYATTAAELAICQRIVKPDGRILGHDFSPGNVAAGLQYGVIPAVQRFCVESGWRFEFLTLDSDCNFSYGLRRLSADL